MLPFQSMSADGMVEDIITGLSRILRLFVIARNSGQGPNQRIAHRQRCRGVPARRSARSRFCPAADFAGDELPENGEMETALDEYAVKVPGLMLYYPSRSQSLPKLRAFADFAQKRMRRDFRAGDYLPTVLP
jgi:hypothetical protein